MRDSSVAERFTSSNSEVRDVQFHPYYSNYFASANDDGTIQVLILNIFICIFKISYFSLLRYGILEKMKVMFAKLLLLIKDYYLLLIGILLNIIKI